jgi:hypothetical protein
MREYPLSLTIDGHRLLREQMAQPRKAPNQAKTIAVGRDQLPLAQPSTSCIT